MVPSRFSLGAHIALQQRACSSYMGRINFAFFTFYFYLYIAFPSIFFTFLNTTPIHYFLTNSLLDVFVPLQAGQWSRLFWAPFLHGDEMHLYYNMGSLLWKGSRLEPQLGPIKFAALVAELLFTSGALYVAAATTMAAKSRFWTRGAFNSCAVGFSGVLFGLKIILNSRSAGWSTVAGFRLPTKYAAWAELVAIQLISPEASFLGHLCGIVAGLLHVYVFSKLFAVVERMWRRSARRNQRSNRGTSRTYGQGTWGS